MSNKAIRGSSVKIEGGTVHVSAYADEGKNAAAVQFSVYVLGVSVCMYLTEFEAAKLSQELFESVTAIAASRTVSPAPTLAEVAACVG